MKKGRFDAGVRSLLTCFLAAQEFRYRIDEFVLALLCVASLEHILRDAVRAHCLFSELSRFGTGRPAGEKVHSRCSRARSDARRGRDEVHFQARVAHDAHMHRHGLIMARSAPSRCGMETKKAGRVLPLNLTVSAFPTAARLRGLTPSGNFLFTPFGRRLQ